MSEIKDIILEKIKAGEAKPIPKWYFVAKAGALVLGAIITALALLYFISFIFFVVDDTGVSSVSAFGWHGLWILLISLPWLLILLCTGFLVLLEIFLRDFAFVYRKPVMNSVVIIAILAGVTGWVISWTHVHQSFELRAEKNQLPLAGRLYRGFHQQHIRYVHPGLITIMQTTSFQMQTHQGDMLIVNITPQTQFPLGIDFKVGDWVVVLGENVNGVIDAQGIRLQYHATSNPGAPMLWPFQNQPQPIDSGNATIN